MECTLQEMLVIVVDRGVEQILLCAIVPCRMAAKLTIDTTLCDKFRKLVIAYPSVRR